MSRLAESKIWCKAKRPGPADYTQPGAMGVQPNSLKPSTTGYAFGKETREGFNLLPSYSKTHLYDHEQAMGKQLTSKRATSPRAHFGTSNREATANTYNAFTFKPR